MSLSVIVKLSVTLCIFLSGNDSSKPLCFRDNHSHRLTERRRVLYMCQIQEFSASQVQHAFHRHEQSMQFIKYIEWLLCQPSPDWLLFWATLHCYLPHAIFSLCISATLKYISVSESGSNVCFITFFMIFIINYMRLVQRNANRLLCSIRLHESPYPTLLSPEHWQWRIRQSLFTKARNNSKRQK